MIYLYLIFEFLKIGLFSFGGGYATVPFLYQISTTFHWYTPQELSEMIAISSVTPGPVGINVATYAGFKTAGLLGAALATISEIIPAFIIVIFVSKILKRFKDNFYVKNTVEILKPISCALLTGVTLQLLREHICEIKAILLLLILLAISWKTKKSPLLCMVIASIVGIILKIFNF